MSRIDTENAKTLRQSMDVVVTVGDESFDNTELTKVTVTLRGPHRELDKGSFTIEASQIDIEARVDGDADYWTAFVTDFDESEVVTYQAGYLGEDMSETRSFYLQDASYDARTKVLKLSGCDRTIELLEKEYSGTFIESTHASVRGAYYNAIKGILDSVGVDYTEAGTVPSGTGSTQSNLFFDKGKARDIIARSCGLFRNGASFSVTYRDAGRPQLIAGDSVVLWEIAEGDLADFTTTNERNVKEYDITLSSYSKGNNEELAKVDNCVAGQEYFVNTTDPIYSVGSTTNCTAQKLGLYAIKITCTTSGTCTVNGRKIVKQTLDADAPREIADPLQNGIVVDLGSNQIVDISTGSLVANAVDDMLSEPTTKYSFKYRGDPRMQPCDIIRIAKEGGSSLLPASDLYPTNSLYPRDGNTKDLRIESITLEHSGGGLLSTITARADTFYISPGTLWPTDTQYPSTTLYPC